MISVIPGIDGLAGRVDIPAQDLGHGLETLTSRPADPQDGISGNIAVVVHKVAYLYDVG